MINVDIEISVRHLRWTRAAALWELGFLQCLNMNCKLICIRMIRIGDFQLARNQATNGFQIEAMRGKHWHDSLQLNCVLINLWQFCFCLSCNSLTSQINVTKTLFHNTCVHPFNRNSNEHLTPVLQKCDISIWNEGISCKTALMRSRV